MSYSTITFTRGDKDLIPTFISISEQIEKPQEVILVIDTSWDDYNFNPFVYRQYETIKRIMEIKEIKFSLYLSYKGIDKFSKLKNFGYSKVNTCYVLYVEDDSIIPFNYGRELVNSFYKHGGLGALGGLQYLVETSNDIQEQPIFERISLPKEEMYQRLIVKEGKLEYDSIKHQCYVYNCGKKLLPCHALLHTYMLSMRALCIVGGWDENAPENGSLIYEEMDVMYRMFKKGFNNYINTGLVMYHHRKGNKRTSNDDLSKREALREERKLYFGQKYLKEGLV